MVFSWISSALESQQRKVSSLHPNSSKKKKMAHNSVLGMRSVSGSYPAKVGNSGMVCISLLF
jgi:hypothetical protein